MSNSIKKRGQKLLRKFSRATTQATEDGRKHIKSNLIGRISHIGNIRLLVLEWGLLATALILLAITQSLWFTESYAEEVFTDGGTYTEATLGDVNSLNPLFATTDSERVLSRLMFATIATIDYSGHPGIGLAASILPSEDGRVWTMRLRDNLKWSDGSPITNEDVLFTFDLIKNPAVSSVYDSSLANVKISEGADGEIVFSLPTIYTDFVAALNIPVVPKHELDDSDPKTLIEDTFSNMPVTSGAFSFNALQTIPASTEKVYYLSANPYYYKGKPLLNSFAIHTYNNKESIIGALNTGAVTATAELSGVDADKIVAGQYQRKDSSINSGAYIFFNTTSASVKNVGLRAAIRQGLDLQKIRSLVPNTKSLDYPILDTQAELSSYPEVPGHDAEVAATKIAEYSDDNPIHVEIATINSGYLPIVADSIKAELEALGIQANVTMYEENQDFINNVINKRAYDLLVYEIELGAGPDLLPYYHSSQTSGSGLNLSNYRNILADDALLGARDAQDEALRIKKYESFLEHWMNDTPAIGLYQSNLTYFYNKNVRSYSNDVRLVTGLDRFTDITNWATVKATKNKTP